MRQRPLRCVVQLCVAIVAMNVDCARGLRPSLAVRRPRISIRGQATAVLVEEEVAPLTTAQMLALDTPRAMDSRLVRIALPAMVGALIDPALSLIDTAWVGRLGSLQLAALVSKHAALRA